MNEDEINSYVSRWKSVLWSELDINFKVNRLSILTVNERNIIGKFDELVTCSSLLEGVLYFFITTECWLSDESNLVSELDGYKFPMINKLERTGWNT